MPEEAPRMSAQRSRSSVMRIPPGADGAEGGGRPPGSLAATGRDTASSGDTVGPQAGDLLRLEAELGEDLVRLFAGQWRRRPDGRRGCRQDERRGHLVDPAEDRMVERNP